MDGKYELAHLTVHELLRLGQIIIDDPTAVEMRAAITRELRAKVDNALCPNKMDKMNTAITASTGPRVKDVISIDNLKALIETLPLSDDMPARIECSYDVLDIIVQRIGQRFGLTASPIDGIVVVPDKFMHRTAKIYAVSGKLLYTITFQ